MNTHRVIPMMHTNVKGKEQYFIIVLMKYNKNTNDKHIIKISKTQYHKILKDKEDEEQE